MKTSLVSVPALAMVAAAVSFLCVEHPPTTHPPTPTGNAAGTQLLSRLPTAFVPNLGQWAHAGRFVARIGAMTVFLEQKGWAFTLVEGTAVKENENTAAHGVAVRMTFAGASAPVLAAEDRLPGRHNYFLGDDPSKWRSDVPLYRAVRYREVHPGVDVRAREQDGHFEYDLVLQPDAELEPVEIAVEGIERMRIDGEGALVMETRLGPVRMPAPLSWEEGPSGEKTMITCRYELRGDNRFGFEATSRRQGWALTVDPGLVWSTFLGGTASDFAHAIAVDAQGASTVAGSTASSTFPSTPGAFDTSINGSSDAFVTRLSPTGSSLVFSTFLGGTGLDQVNALALDAQGAATVGGSTTSADFPTTAGAFDTSFSLGSYDAFVTRLSPTGSSLVFSTFLGGLDFDDVSDLALDGQGAATLSGQTNSTDFPTTPGAFDTSHNGVADAFVTRLSPSGSSLVYSTFLGGASVDDAGAIALDAQGAATVVGITISANFPRTAGAFDTSFNGPSDAFVTRLSATGSSLVYSTLLGGGGAGGEEAYALAVDAQGAATVTGLTGSTDFPTTPGAFDTTYNGGNDAFVTRLSPTGSSLVYSTFLGGTTADEGRALALDPQGAVTVAGYTNAPDFPTTPGASDTSFNGGSYDSFVTRLSATGSNLVYSTFLGGTDTEQPSALALDAQDAATVAGYTRSTNFPTTAGAFDTSFNGVGFYDAFVTRLDMLPTGVAAFGRSSPGCTGPLAISVNSMPRIGNATFAVTCGNAPPNSGLGILDLDGGPLPGFPLLGIDLWVGGGPWFLHLFAASNADGAASVALPLPNDPNLVGGDLYAQFIWIGPNSPPPCPPLGLSASNALEITIQP